MSADEKLDVLIKLNAYAVIKNIKKQSDQIHFLKKIGISNKDIAMIVGTTENYISTVMARKNKSKEKNRG